MSDEPGAPTGGPIIEPEGPIKDPLALTPEEIGAHRGFSEVVPEADRKRRAQTRVGEFSFGVDTRCTRRGAASFGSYVMASVVTANLLIIACHMLR
jgi:hypothetical protein